MYMRSTAALEQKQQQKQKRKQQQNQKQKRQHQEKGRMARGPRGARAPPAIRREQARSDTPRVRICDENLSPQPVRVLTRLLGRAT